MTRTITIFCCLYYALSFSQSSEKDTLPDATLQKQITFRDVTVEKGLSQNSVVSIAQDSTGYLWFATQDGLNRYDGKTFKYYNKRFDDITRPEYSRLGKVYVDRHKGLWIISTSGILEKLDTTSDVFIPQEGISDISSVYRHTNDDLYIGTFGNGVYKIGAKSQDTSQLFKNDIGKRNIFGFFEKDKRVFALSSNGLVEIKDTTISISGENLAFNSAVNSNDKTWFGTYGNGLYFQDRLDDDIKAFTGFNNNNRLPENLNIQALLMDSNDRLWIATYGNGAYLIDISSKVIRHFVAQKSNPFALHYNDVLSLYEDYTGTIWLGTDGAGLSYYDENLAKFNVLTNNQTPKDINVDVIRAIEVDAENTIWLGTSGKGLTSYNSLNDSYKTYTTTNSGISSDRVMSLLNNDNELFIGFQGHGLNVFSEGRFNNFEALSDLTVWKIYKDSIDRIWLCTRDDGLLLFDRERGILRSYNTDNSVLSSNNIRTIEEANDGSLWVGTESDGLFKLNPDSHVISEVTSIGNDIKSLYQDDQGILWIGTNGSGLLAYDIDMDVVKSFTRDDGLPNNVIYSILPDEGNNLWLSSNRGISRFNLDENQVPELVNYNNYDGLQALEFNTGAYYKDSKGYLYFGGLEGLNWFKPDALTKNPIPPKTVINKLEIFSEEQDIVQDAKYKHNQNTMTFSFAGLHFSLPERNNYRYKLIPYDQDWVETKNTNTAHYPKLPPDRYEFQVMSSNYDDVWNDEAATYAFTIKQPWFFNTLAKVIYGLLILLSGIWVYRYLKWRWHMKMQLQYEHSETERLKQLDEAKSRLYTNISHEFRTPLTLISGPIDKQLSKTDLNADDKKDLTLVQRSAKRLLNLVNQMLDLSKLESGSLKLHVTQGNLSALLKQLAAAFQFKAEEKNIHFTSKILQVDKAWFDRDLVEKIVTNLLSNAIKYAPEGGNVAFDTTLHDGQLILTVVNNGNTITDDELGKLFHRFYQTNKTSDGVGIGLSLVKELAILSHGNIVAHTMNDGEIQFTVTLPIEHSFYDQSEIVFEEQDHLEDSGLLEEIEDVELGLQLTESLPLLLIVEDDKDVREYIMSIFEKDYKLIEAADGKDGIAKAQKFVPDLIISDIMMPVSDGIVLCNTLKHDERTSHIPIVLLTAKVGEESELKGLETGADAYITKPFNRDILEVRVQKLIESRRQLRERYSQEFDLNPKILGTTSTDQKFLTRLQEILEEHLEDPSFNSETLGDKMLMSRMQLHRKLKAIIGMSASEFLRSQRLKLAVKLMETSDRNVSEIAYDIGFNTPSYFIKCFKEAYNCTPSEYLTRVK